MAEVLPHNLDTWAAAASRHGVGNSWITARSSGSDFTYWEFLMLRSIWPNRVTQVAQIVTEQWMSSELQKRSNEARNFLRGSNDWQSYLNSLEPSKSGGVTNASVNVGGTFSLVRYYQFLSSRGRKEEKKGPGPDVMTPKVAMITRSRARQDPTTTPTRGGKATHSPVLSPRETLDDAVDSLESLGLDSPIPRTPRSGGTDASSSLSLLSPYTPLHSWGPGFAEAVEDEQIINTALILFLNALTIHCPGVADHWTLYRRPFTYCAPNGDKVYEARVDGLLRSSRNDARIIVEVKPCYRCDASLKENDPVPKLKIRMQETAQMVAWIYESHKATFKYGSSGRSHSPGSQRPGQTVKSQQTRKYTRLLLSQDQQEIFVTLARYDDDYVSYLFQERAKESLLEMTDYGPFNVLNAAHMKHLGNSKEYCKTINAVKKTESPVHLFL